MTNFLELAKAVEQQARDFLDEHGVPYDAPFPDQDESRTQGDFVAAPIPEDRVTAALAILRTVEALGTRRMELLNQVLVSPKKAPSTVDRIAWLCYRLRMYQDAMHSKKLRDRYLGHHTRKPRKRGAEREGSAAWLVAILTRRRTLDDALESVIDMGGQVSIAGQLLEVLRDGKPVNKLTNQCDVRYRYRDKWRKVSVKRLREVA